MSAIWYLLDFPKCWEKSERLNLIEACKREGTIKEVFLPSYDRMKRYQGAWHIESRYLFPDSIFLKENDGERFLHLFRDIYSELLQETEACALTSVDEKAVDFLQELCGKEQHMPLSRGYIHDGTTFVTEGPLRGKESFIRRIDRHKRLARLEIPIPERNLVDVGLEIYAKD